MKIRIMSDLHLDINRDYPLSIDDKSIFTIIAGDTAGETSIGIDWIKNNCPNSCCIAGNHLVYNRYGKSLSELINWLKNEFPNNSNIRFLNNDWMFVPNTNNSIAVIGSTLYTDYAYCDYTIDDYNKREDYWDTWGMLYGLPVVPRKKPTKLTKKLIQEHNMFEAKMALNDFKWGYIDKNNHITPNDYLKLHKLAKKEIKRCNDEILTINPNCKIILVTHHCLSPKCIDAKYVGQKTNSSYVSDLEKWVDNDLKNIRLVVSGHVHNRFDFRFGNNNVRYIVNPRGYVPYNEDINGDIQFNPNLIIDTDDL